MSGSPSNDGEIEAYWKRLGLPGLADIHVHFLPENMLAKVWSYFDAAEENYGRAWPIQYRFAEQQRVDLLRSFGLVGIPSLAYAHKPGMVEWLNIWCAEFAKRIPDAVPSATMYPEAEVDRYVRQALARGSRLFKMHVQVGVFSPDDERLDPGWAQLQEAEVPIVLHAALRRVLANTPALGLSWTC